MKENKKVFCSKCEKYVDYDVVDAILEGKIKNKLYAYDGQKALCKKCKSLLYVPKINDANLDSLYGVYRSENDIVPLKVVVDLPKKYNIGKRPLSNLLGWGELTYTRYIDGDIPSRNYSDLIIELYENPKKFNELLEKNKKSIENITYKKCKSAVNEILKINENKINDIVDYILYKSCNDITPLTIQKLLYYIQGFFYAFNNEYIFIDDCEAWVHGPVYYDVYKKYKEYKYKPINRNKVFDKTKLNKKELLIIDNVIDSLGCYSGNTLESFTHLEDPWIQTRNGLSATDNCNRTIRKDVIGSFFKGIVSDFEIYTPKQINKYSEYMFKKI